MPSNKNRATRFLIRRSLFIGVIVFLAVFYVMPFWALSHIPDAKEALAAADLAMPEEMAKRFSKTVSSEVMTDPLNLEMMVALYGGLGFVTAMMLMSHQFSRRQSMLHAALPDKREADFLRRCAAYAVLCLVPIGINFLLYLLIVAAKGMLGYVAWDVLLPKFGLLLVINLYGFAMGMLASVLTGTYWAALLAGAVLIVGAEALAALWYWLGGRYLHTLIKSSFTHALLHFSPAYSLYKGFYKPAEFVWQPGAAAIVLALLLSFALYRVRRAERAEHTLAFAPLHGVMGFVLPLLGGTFLGIVVKLSFLSEISLIAGMIAGTVLTFWICRIVFNQRFCGILKQWYIPAASAAVLVLGVAVLHFDVLGYDSFLPEREKLTAITYRPQSYNTDEIITLTSGDALDAAYEWCALMKGEVDGYEDGLVEGSDTFSGSSVLVTYQMGDRKVYRHYPNRRIRNEAQDSLRRVIESDDYRQSLIDECQLDTGNVWQLYLDTQSNTMREDAFFERFGMSVAYRGISREEDAQRIDELLLALKEDILNRTFEDKQEDAIISIDLNIKSPDSGNMLYTRMNVYPGDTNFLKAVFGDQAEAVVRYVTGDFARSEDIAVVKVDYALTRSEMSRSHARLTETVDSVALASSPEEAVRWIAQAQSTSADNYYYMPYIEDAPYQRLYIYQMNEVEKYAVAYEYEVPQDRAKLYGMQSVPTMMTMDYMGEY